MPEFRCDLCDEICPSVRKLKQHRIDVHPVAKGGAKFPCDMCPFSFSYSGLRKHKLRDHSASDGSISANSINCDESFPSNNNCESGGNRKCGHCGSGFSKQIDLCKHLNEQHGLNLEIHELKFANHSEFNSWMSTVSTEGKFEFHKIYKDTSRKGTIGEGFQCHRSGSYESQSTGERGRMKKTIKIGFDCSAFATVRTNKQNGTINVTTCTQHYGHDDKLANLHVPAETKKKVADMMVDERGKNYILKEIRNNVPETGITRETLLTVQDLHNIERALGLRKAEKCSNDARSVAVWVKETKEQQGDKSSLFMYEHKEVLVFNKKTGQQEKRHYFTLGIEDEFQMEMLRELGDKCICVDSTHHPTQYPLLLVTVMVIDEFGSGFPAAWFLTTSESQDLLQEFFTHLFQRVGPIDAQVFMSDDAEGFWNAWKSVFGADNTKKLLCSWHVKRSWEGHYSEITDSKIRTDVKNTLDDLLMQCHEKADFYHSITKLQTLLNDHGEKKFLHYFENNYLKSEKRVEQWAHGVQCTKCKGWLHENCIGPYEIPYKCNNCTKKRIEIESCSNDNEENPENDPENDGDPSAEATNENKSLNEPKTKRSKQNKTKIRIF